jgi:hypothetical protein
VLAAVGRVHLAGVRVTAGTDGGIASIRPHGIVHAEITPTSSSSTATP